MTESYAKQRNYPRSCGEEAGAGERMHGTLELPPLVRGRDCLTWLFIGGGPGNGNGTEFQICGSPGDVPVCWAQQPRQFPPLKFSLFRPAYLYRTQARALDDPV